MKGILGSLLAVAVFAIAFTTDAQAQRYIVSSKLSAVSQPASTATNRAVVLDVRQQPSFNLQIEAQADAAGAYNLGFFLQRSVDGSVYDTGEAKLIAFNGTSKVTTITNIPTYGAGYFKLAYTTNSHATINCTNLTVKTVIQDKAPNPW